MPSAPNLTTSVLLRSEETGGHVSLTEIATTLRLSVATVGERAAAIAVRLAATESPAVPAAR